MKTWVKIEKTDKDRQYIVNLLKVSMQTAYGLLKYHKNDKKVLLIELQNDRAVLQYMKGYKEPYRVFSDAMDRENSKVGQFKTITTAKKAFENLLKNVNKYNIVPDREQIEIFDPNVKNAISGVNHMKEALEEIINMCSFDDFEKLDRLKSLAESSANFALTNIYDSYIKG